jgi:uncharacterized protein (TIGR02246 family)
VRILPWALSGLAVFLVGSAATVGRLLLLSVICGEAIAESPTNSDETAIVETVSAWVTGWNAHDASALGRLLTANVDFVLVNGRELHGRDEFTRLHAEQFAGRYAQSSFTEDGHVAISFLKSNVALANWRWTITGVRNSDGQPAPTYRGIFTWVLVEDHGRWEVRAAQNTVDR